MENSNYDSDLYNKNINKILNYIIIEKNIIQKNSINTITKNSIKRNRYCS